MRLLFVVPFECLKINYTIYMPELKHLHYSSEESDFGELES